MNSPKFIKDIQLDYKGIERIPTITHTLGVTPETHFDS